MTAPSQLLFNHIESEPSDVWPRVACTTPTLTQHTCDVPAVQICCGAPFTVGLVNTPTSSTESPRQQHIQARATAATLARYQPPICVQVLDGHPRCAAFKPTSDGHKPPIKPHNTSGLVVRNARCCSRTLRLAVLSTLDSNFVQAALPCAPAFSR